LCPQTPNLCCTFEEAELNTLRAGLAVSAEAKVQWFEEMLALAAQTGALARRRAEVDAEYGARVDIPGLLAHLRQNAERGSSL